VSERERTIAALSAQVFEPAETSVLDLQRCWQPGMTALLHRRQPSTSFPLLHVTLLQRAHAQNETELQLLAISQQ